MKKAPSTGISNSRAKSFAHEGAQILENSLRGLISLSYLRVPNESLLNQANALWIDGKTPLLTDSERKSIVRQILAKQNPDGGWSASSLASPGLKRHDGTPEDTASDGYGTGLAVLALQKAPQPAARSLALARRWLEQNEQADGSWRATSLNARRDPNTDVGKFMTDAATAYALIALGESKR